MEIYSFYGEFGLFNLRIIGLLEFFFEKYPYINIRLSTYENYKKILLIKFKDNITFIDKYSYEASRRCNVSPLIKNDETINIIHLFESILIYNNNDFYHNLWDNDFFYFPIKDKLLVNKPIKKNICILPRNRPDAIGLEGSDINRRNIDANTVINIIEFIINNYSNYDIYILGHINETVNIDWSKYDVIREDDITTSVSILNNCDLLFSPCSGYIDFAKNCGVHNIILLCKLCYTNNNKDKYVNGHTYHSSNHSFEKCNIKYVRYDEDNYIENIKNYIDNTDFNIKENFINKNNLKKNLKIKEFDIIGNYLYKIDEDDIAFSIKSDMLDKDNKVKNSKVYRSSGISLTVFKFINNCFVYFEIVSNKSINLGLRYYNGKEWNKIEDITELDEKKYFKIKFEFNSYKTSSPTRISFDNIEDSIITIKNIKIEPK